MASNRIPRSLVDEQRRGLDRLSKEAAELLAHYYRRGIATGTKEGLAEWMVQGVRDVTAVYGEIAEAFTAEVIEQVALVEKGEHIDVVTPDSSTAWWIQKAVDDIVEGRSAHGKDVQQAANVLVDRAIKTASHNTVYEHASASGTCYAVIPNLPTCPWCLMLASRGFVYRSAQNARKSVSSSAGFHDHCDCQVMSGADYRSSVEGYDPDALYEVYKEAWRAAGGDGTHAPDVSDVLANIGASGSPLVKTGES